MASKKHNKFGSEAWKDASVTRIFCDGSFVRGSKPRGGWAIVAVRPDGSKRVRSGSELGSATSQRMELAALIEAINEVDPDERAYVLSDSQYAVKGSRWVYGWSKKGWRRSDGNPVANVDLWKSVMVAVSTRKMIEIGWIPRHLNAEADAAAVSARMGRIVSVDRPLQKGPLEGKGPFQLRSPWEHGAWLLVRPDRPLALSCSDGGLRPATDGDLDPRLKNDIEIMLSRAYVPLSMAERLLSRGLFRDRESLSVLNRLGIPG